MFELMDALNAVAPVDQLLPLQYLPLVASYTVRETLATEVWLVACIVPVMTPDQFMPYVMPTGAPFAIGHEAIPPMRASPVKEVAVRPE